MREEFRSAWGLSDFQREQLAHAIQWRLDAHPVAWNLPYDRVESTFDVFVPDMVRPLQCYRIRVNEHLFTATDGKSFGAEFRPIADLIDAERETRQWWFCDQ